LLRCSKSPTFPSEQEETKWGNALGWLLSGVQTLALITAYLARTAQRNAGRTTATAKRSLFERIALVARTVSSAASEAREMRRAMTQKYPFIDI
jgi:hypothetical protein